ncbi:MAG: archaeosortase/exosortase family protein, partial [Phycisphaerales bacterium]|nr:archaeosortase/exosortase family protein [Phycisphaerales bacterium]
MTTAATQPTATGARSLREFGRGEWLAIGVLSLAFVGLFFRWFATQNKHSLRSLEDWGHAYIIPVISAYVIWQHREAISKVTPRVFWPGAAPFLLGIMSYFFCLVGVKNHMLQGFSMILTLFGLVLLLGGPRLMRHLFLPIAYLGFGVTIAEKLMLAVTFQLKLLASQGAFIMLSTLGSIFGYACDVQGNLLTITPQGGDPIPLNV